jgi:hypothetical protein
MERHAPAGSRLATIRRAVCRDVPKPSGADSKREHRPSLPIRNRLGINPFRETVAFADPPSHPVPKTQQAFVLHEACVLASEHFMQMRIDLRLSDWDMAGTGGTGGSAGPCPAPAIPSIPGKDRVDQGSEAGDRTRLGVDACNRSEPSKAASGRKSSTNEHRTMAY